MRGHALATRYELGARDSYLAGTPLKKVALRGEPGMRVTMRTIVLAGLVSVIVLASLVLALPGARRRRIHRRSA